MNTIVPARMTATHDGSVVVFVIGMRINAFRKLGKWLPVARAMGPMIAELSRNPDSGFLGTEYLIRGLRTVVLLQYWRDFDSLEAYARDREQKHWPAWVAFNKAVGTDGTVGIFHETYVVPAGAHETIYANMPPFGLGKVSGLAPATGSRNAARSRMRGAD
ncbi:DUF4188 domain-containing protein [Novosphingobium cyanobacteriorum]|uniref:DUF4188 domain-containing protein n=1 Tax=Novosphingobium cyanobacteriorum TaxID=3024215 RepID=A0ABT6CLK5_9SPHN|nr:DUF4188 domain-containing protein [Novosphingobium cyanobacteriorum]MDF8334399.1 DUF4188 domain-containing protein [Novosphingobium cyanobacteriorum]